MDWTQILSAVLLVGMLIFLLPRAKHMLLNSPKASSPQWLNFFLILAGVVAFVALLIFSVRS